MAILLMTPPFRCPPSISPSLRPTSLNLPKPFDVCFKERFPRRTGVLRFSSTPLLRFVKLVPFANNGGETETTETQQEAQIEDSLDGAVSVEEDTTGDESSDFEDTTSSTIPSLLLTYKEALASNDDSKVAAIEEFLNSIEDEKVDLEKKMTSLSEELSIEKDRILRISADFDNFRKRTQRERLSLLHEAIMRVDSAEFEEGIILQEFRKGFKLRDRLLRPLMVKVSAGPGAAKPEQVDSSEGAVAGESSKSCETFENNDAESGETTKTDPGSAKAS